MGRPIRKQNFGNTGDAGPQLLLSADIGAGKEGLQKIGLTLTKEDDHVLLDFTETSPENDGCYNNFGHCVIGHAVHVLFWGTFCDLPISTGLLSSHKFKFKPQTLLHASMWASTMVSPAYLNCIFPLVTQCYNKMRILSELCPVSENDYLRCNAVPNFIIKRMYYFTKAFMR